MHIFKLIDEHVFFYASDQALKFFGRCLDFVLVSDGLSKKALAFMSATASSEGNDPSFNWLPYKKEARKLL